MIFDLRYMAIILSCFAAGFSHAQSNYSSNYAFTFGFHHNDQLVNVNEHFLNEGLLPLPLNGTSIGLSSNHCFKQFVFQGKLDMNSLSNKPSDNDVFIRSSQMNITAAFGYDFFKSNRFSIIPSLGIGIGRSFMNFEFPDTSKSFQAILNGNATTSSISSNITFLVNPKIELWFTGRDSEGDGFLIESGYYYAPYRLKWDVSDVSLTRMSGFYFRFGFYLSGAFNK